jgi:NADPH-dependent glutamate synthase beta subunit-like oxidoreductase/Pyruvate/2-oxoacid:ferredoxin oxidoreductase delta subunit
MKKNPAKKKTALKKTGARSKKPIQAEPSLPPMSLSFDGTLAVKTGTWRYLTPTYVNKLAPCNEACPAGEDVEAAMVLSGQGDYIGAWERITRENPLPRVCGRVCFHPCEGSCNRKEYDEPTAINALERFVGDFAFQGGKRFSPPGEKKNEKVAVVGSGPAGLSCAYHLASLGYGVTLFEALPRLGGMLRYGIPAYRLPKDVLDQEIDLILALGVETRTHCRVGKDVKWEELKTYDAIFVAAGAWKSLPLGVPGEHSEGVLSGVNFLQKVNSGEKVELGERVAVIGGGNTAMDAARSALRLGAKPLIIYRRTKEEMPAWEEEISEAEEEKIDFIFLTSPVNVLSENGRVKGIECIKNLLGPPGRDGRREPRPIENSNFALPVDSVISAIGEAPDLSSLPSELQKFKGAIPVDEAGATSLPRVFAGGDAAGQPRTVSYAIGSGKKAAMAIDATLRGKNAAEAIRLARWGEKGSLSMARYRRGGSDGIAGEVVPFSELNTAYFPRQKRKPKERLSLEGRTRGFSEVNRGLPMDTALFEAKRCFNCGVCNLCDNCFFFCPDLAISARPDKQGYEINYDYCKGCCICVEECPRGAISVEVKK